MNLPAPFDPLRFSYLNLQPVEKYHNIKREAPYETSSVLDETEEATNDGSTFTFFPELPLELQRRIWFFATQFPRIVEVHEVKLYAWIVEASESSDSKSIPPQRSEISHFRSKTDDPPLLRACRESRDAALKKYRRVDLANQYCADSVYFEFDCDTMYASRRTMNTWAPHLSAFHTADSPNISQRGLAMKHKVRSLAFDAGLLLHRPVHSIPGHSSLAPHPYASRDLVALLQRFHNLEEIILVLNEDHMTTSDSKLSSIRFYEPESESAITATLQEVANLLDKELRKAASAMAVQAELLSEGIRRNLGGIPMLSQYPLGPVWKPPSVRTMVTKLRAKPTAQIVDEVNCLF